VENYSQGGLIKSDQDMLEFRLNSVSGKKLPISVKLAAKDCDLMGL